MTISPSETTAIKMKLAELQQALVAKVPTMPGLLKDIHTQLKNMPECVTLLDESEISIIIQASQGLVHIDLAAETVKSAKKSTTKNALKSIGVDDL